MIISRIINFITFSIGNFCINIISTLCNTCLVFKTLSWLHFCLEYYYRLYFVPSVNSSLQWFHKLPVSFIWFLLHPVKLYLGFAESMSIAFSMSALLIFQMQLISSALFLNAKGLFFLLLLLVPVIVIVPLTTIYTLLKSDWSWASIYFLVINLGKSSDVVPNKFVIFWYSIFTRCQNSLTSSIICCLIPGGM